MESLDSSEKRKIVDVIKSGKDGAESGSTMDWMYSDKKHNTDDYLLGKKIDKHFEKQDETPPKEDDMFGERIKANIALDMQAKMREDPLYAIKKREEESRKKILHNPVKMKELQTLIAQQKREKKKKIKKKHKHSGLNDNDDLVQQYLSILTQKHGRHKGNGHHNSRIHSKGERHRSVSSDSSGSSVNHQRQQSKSTKTYRKGERHHSASTDYTDNFNKQESKSTKTYRKRERLLCADSNSTDDQHRQQSKTHSKGESHDPEDTSKRHSRKSDEYQMSWSLETNQTDYHGSVQHPGEGGRRMSYSTSQIDDPIQKRRYGLIKSSRRQSLSKSRSRSPKSTKRKSSLSPSRHSSPHRSGSPHAIRSQQHSRQSCYTYRIGQQSRKWSPRLPKRKVGQEERERLIKEMMDNAKWREDQRKNNMKRYREEDQRKEEQGKKKGSSADFLNPIMSQHATNSTVEDRLRRNKYNIQRTKAALDRDFTRH